MATRVSKCARMRTVIMEELPEPYRLKKFTSMYLIPESVLLVYLLVNIVWFEPRDKDEDHFKKFCFLSDSIFAFICIIPFMALRIISLLCCMNLRYVPLQIFGIWFLNLIVYAAWALFALYEMMTTSEKREYSIEFINTLIMLVLFSTSICTVACGIPFFLYKICERASKDKDMLSRKVG